MTTRTPEPCPHCGGDVAIRNPTGKCDHLYYPENCEVCKNWDKPGDDARSEMCHDCKEKNYALGLKIGEAKGRQAERAKVLKEVSNLVLKEVSNLEKWFNRWYNHSWNDSDARSSKEICEVKKILKQMKGVSRTAGSEEQTAGKQAKKVRK